MRNVKEPRNSAEARRCPFTPPYPDDLDEPQQYGDQAECAVCGRPLDRAPEPDGYVFCEEHDEDDLRVMEEQVRQIIEENRKVRQIIEENRETLDAPD